jgi:15-cis-phytoene synthase
MVHRHARTFALASRLLPRHKRRGVYAVYAFCRTADDIVDRATDPRGAATALSRLREYRNAFNAAMHQPPRDEVLRELVRAMARFEIPRAPFETLLAGVERDLSSARYATWNDLQRYCRGVASSVGEMCTAVFGTTGGWDERERALGHARTLGLAMQLTNILRDVGEDAGRGRVYLPEEDLRRFSLSREQVLDGTAVRAATSWRALMRFQIARARELYRAAAPGIALLQSDAQRCALACASGYAEILAAIEAIEFDSFSRRAVVRRTELLRVLVRVWTRRLPELPPVPLPPDAARRTSHATV